MITIAFVLTVLLLAAIHKYIKFKKYFDLINKIPGPPAIPIIGNLPMLNVSTNAELWNVMRNVNKQYYPMTRVWLGTIPLVSIYHPNDLKVILSGMKNLEKGYTYKFLHPWLKTGLLTGHGNKWQHRRKILIHAFHFNVLQKYCEIINGNAKASAENLKKEESMTIELVKFCTSYTLHTLCESAMGVALDKMDKQNAEDYKNAVNAMGNVIVYRPFLPDWMFNTLTKFGRIQNSALKILHKFTDKVLMERKEYHDRTNNKYLTGFEVNTNDDDEDFDNTLMVKKKKLAMLDLLIKAEKDNSIDENGMKEELDTFTFAGHDTTGMALVFLLMLLAEHQEIQDELRAEITMMVNENGGDILISRVQELNYLDRCIKESLRLYPPVHTITRFLEEETCLGGYMVPKGVEVGCFIVDAHRDPNFWPEPTKFDPNRFLPDNIKGRHPYSYVPFSAGPRNCIGLKFALIEIKSVVAHILYNFRLESVTKSSDIKMALGVVARPSTPVFAKFIKINHND